MKAKMSVIFSITSLLFLFISCSSLPLPGSPTESLFILCGDLDRDLGVNITGDGHTLENVKISVMNLETEKKDELIFYPSKKFVSTTLEPGKYKIESKIIVTVRYKGGDSSQSHNEFIATSPFLIEDSTVFVSPFILSVSAHKGWYGISSYFSSSESNILKKESIEAVFSERRYKAWELYQLIGWDVEEE
jgi:hypothetical protein